MKGWGGGGNPGGAFFKEWKLKEKSYFGHLGKTNRLFIQIILTSFLSVSSENTPSLNIFFMFETSRLRFFGDVLKCHFRKKVLCLAKIVVGNPFFYSNFCFSISKREFWAFFLQKTFYIMKKRIPNNYFSYLLFHINQSFI